ncbi:MAG: hydrolase [Verrucomicrobiae bacterium]|nr:hydrolase [Verrucomicrobiae bacterium]
MKHPIARARAADSVLLVVDLQEKLMPVIHEGRRVLELARKVIQVANLLKVPILVTEQYPKGIGPTCAEIKQQLGDTMIYEKLTFSGCGAEHFLPRWEQMKHHTTIVCGVEAHVCVQQTVLDLLERDQHVLVLADAVSSRHPRDYELALQRMNQAGATVTTTESVIFEWLGRAGTPEFKEALKLVK